MSYHIQVRKAASVMLDFIARGLNFCVLAAAMQSGKTEFIACLHELLKKMFPRSMSFYVTAHNHIDFVGQNFSRLEHLKSQDLYCLTLRERRKSLVGKKPISSFSNEPVFVFFDEHHFGDAVEQTIYNWLTVNKLHPGRQVFLVGISATPFSSIEKAGEAVVRFSLTDMPHYKSVTYMLENGHIREATPIIRAKKGSRTLLTNSTAYQHLESLINSGSGGYAILRITKQADALFLANELEKRFCNKVYVRHWNQQNQISSAKEYFEQERVGVFTVVIVQQKARMGNTIPTRHVKMVYEYSPTATVATISQSLLGRCCGHGKLKDDVTVFTHTKQAEAYSLFESGKQDEFIEFLEQNNLKASHRSIISGTEVAVLSGECTVSESTCRKDIIRVVTDDLTKNHNIKEFTEKPIVRRFESNKNAEERKWYRDSIASGINPAIRKLDTKSGSLAIFYDNRPGANRVYYAFRTDKVIIKGALLPSEQSMYSTL